MADRKPARGRKTNHADRDVRVATITTMNRMVELTAELVEQIIVGYLLQNNYGLLAKPGVVDEKPAIAWNVDDDLNGTVDGTVKIASCRVTFAQRCEQED